MKAAHACASSGAAALRRRRMAHRRALSLGLGPAMRLQFEDADTLLHQASEVLRAERLSGAEALQRELAHYAHLMPDATQWCATLFIELPDAAQRARGMPALSAAAHRLFVQCDGQPRVFAQANEDLPDRHRARPSGVHFLRFELPQPMRHALLRGAPCTIGCADDAYAWRRRLPAPLLRALAAGLCDALPVAARAATASAHASPAHASPAHASPAHASPARVSPAHVSPAHVSPAHVSPAHLPPALARPSHG